MGQGSTQRVAVDTGGTFVGTITFDRETRDIALEKVATIPNQSSEDVIESVNEVDTDLESTNAFVHGITLGLNTVLECDDARTDIITNEGFADVYEIGRTDLERTVICNINYKKPKSIVPCRRRVGVLGRLDADGAVVEEIDTSAVAEAAEYLVEKQDIDSIAICFPHVYQNSQHEQAATECAQDAYPDISVSVSSDISGEYREYKRTSTAVLDGYIEPIFESYVDTLDASLRDGGFGGSFFVTRSGGGTPTAENAKSASAHAILSGPAGGLVGASHVGRVTDRNNLIAVSMGGTSLDAAAVEDGSPVVKYDSSLEHQPLMIPVYDTRTIGAGGDSIAWIDDDLLKVGPENAGAGPGPICHDDGGTQPTVTDAALALGFLDPGNFLGGDVDTVAGDALGEIGKELAEPLGMTVDEASKGVLDVALANTVGAIREITVERGLDPRDFSMVTYGGADPVFAPLPARELNASGVLVPQAPSVFSAQDALMTDIVYDFFRTHLVVLDNAILNEPKTTFANLETEGRETLTVEEVAENRQRVGRAVEIRYFGQEHTVEVDAGGVSSLDKLAERFEDRHETRYGHTIDDPIQVIHLRIHAVDRNDEPELERGTPREDSELTSVDTRKTYCFAEDDFVEFDVYRRDDLEPSDEIHGPAVVTEPTTSLVFHSDQTATTDDYGHVIITTDQ